MTKQIASTGFLILVLAAAGNNVIGARPGGPPEPTLKASLTGISGLEPIREAANKLRVAAPIPPRLWTDALPLGNGEMGGLLYGEGSKLMLAVDRGDLWAEQDMPETLEKGWDAMQKPHQLW